MDLATLGGLFSVTGIVGVLIGGIKALSLTDIEKIYMSPGSLVLNKIINILFFGLLVMLISLCASFSLYELTIKNGSEFWQGDVLLEYVAVLFLLLLFFIVLFITSVPLYEFFENKVIKNLVLWSGILVMFLSTLSTIMGYMVMNYLIYNHYIKVKGLNTHNILQAELPLLYLITVAFIFLLSCALLFVSYNAVRSTSDTKPLLTEIDKDSEIFKNGMILLYSIKQDKQVVLPVQEGLKYTTDTYPQYIYDLNNNKIVKYALFSPSENEKSKNEKPSKLKWFCRKREANKNSDNNSGTE